MQNIVNVYVNVESSKKIYMKLSMSKYITQVYSWQKFTFVSTTLLSFFSKKLSTVDSLLSVCKREGRES